MTIFFRAEIAFGENVGKALSPGECIQRDIECKCYNKAQQQKIYDRIIDYDKCQLDLKAKDDYINNRVNTSGVSAPLAWWQEPYAVVGGIVVSASLATVITVLVIK